MAQSLPSDALEDDALVTVVVTGTRLNLSTAQGIKRDKIEIVDAVAANDIAKLPDFSVTEALQRVTGVQIARDRGEGGTETIRGLTQMELALQGNMRDIINYADRLDERFGGFAERLCALAKQYRSRAIQELIEHHLQQQKADS